MDSRKWTFRIIAFLLVTVLLGAGLNFYIDPYDIFVPSTKGAINYYKIHNNDRMSKSVALRNNQYDLLIYGNSVAKRSISPHSQLLEDYHAYNLAVRGLLINELVTMNEYALRHQPALKRVIMVLGFYSFLFDSKYRNGFRESLFNPHTKLYKLYLKSLLSYEAFHSTYMTVLNYFKHPKEYIDRGYQFFNFSSDDESYLKQFKVFLFRNDLCSVDMNYPANMKKFTRILHELAQRSIDFDLIIPPQHPYAALFFYKQGLWDNYLDWIRQTTKLIAQINQQNHLHWKIWYFKTLDPTVLNKEGNTILHYRQYFQDVVHIQPSLGEKLISSMQNGATTPVVKVNEENVASLVAEINQQFSHYRQSHPQDVQWMDKKFKVYHRKFSSMCKDRNLLRKKHQQVAKRQEVQ